MNKQEFLNELQSRIRILEEAEQQDILAEYAQHIDLRTAAGLSEEEAIRDFGDLEELAAEILEAYHVDPSRVDAPSPQPLAGVSSGLKRTAGRLPALFPPAGRRHPGPGGADRRRGAASRSVCTVFAVPRLPDPLMPQTPERASSRTSRLRLIRAGAARSIRRLGRLFRELARLAWNLLLLLIALPFAAAGVLAILSIGVPGSAAGPGVSPGGAAAVLSGIGPLLCRFGRPWDHADLEASERQHLRRSAPESRRFHPRPVFTPLVPTESHNEEVSVHA